MNKADRITQAREAAGLNKSELARKIGVTHTTIGLWESGDTKNLKNDHLYDLEQITGYSAKWIATGKGEKFSKSFDLTDREAELIRKFRLSSDSEQEMLIRALSK